MITTGGIYGQVTRLGDQSVQLQIADKIRIEVAKAAIGGYQGQAPVVEPQTQSRGEPGDRGPHRQAFGWTCRSSLETHHHRRGLRRSSPPSASTRSSRPGSGIPLARAGCIDEALKLGLDLKGGVHLVLRVQTDDALKLETETEMERLREPLTHARHSSRQHRASWVRPSSRSKASRPDRTRRSGRPRPKSRRTSIAAPASAAPTRSR